jgi:chromosome segregation ATPase
VPDLGDLAVSIYQNSMDERSVAGEERLDYQSRIEEANDEYRENMRKLVASQTEGSLQARIKQLEEDDRALAVANAKVKASEQVAKTEVSNRDATVRSKDAAISDLEKKKEKEKNARLYNALGQRANAEWLSQQASISMLETNTSELENQRATLAKKVSNLGAAVLSQDASINRLEVRNSVLIQENSAFRKEAGTAETKNKELEEANADLQKRVLALDEELKAAKEANEMATA